MNSPRWTPVFTPNGTVAHLLDSLYSPNSFKEASCGRSPWPSNWHGTGTQEEEEKAAELPLCVRCKAVLLHQRGGG